MYPDNNDLIIAYTHGPAASIQQQQTINSNDWISLNNWSSFTDDNMATNSESKGNGCYHDV